MQLYKIGAFDVRSRTSSKQFKDTDKEAQVIGKDLNVNFLVEGSIQMYGDELRIHVQLIQTSTDGHIWGDTYEGQWKDIFDIQSDVAKQVANELAVALSPEEVELIEKAPTENLEAYNLYLQGRQLLSWDFAKLQIAESYFEQALQKDPNFALSYVGMAGVSFNMGFIEAISSQEANSQISEYLNKALELDNNLGEAYRILGNMNLYFLWDWEAAERYLKQALELTPNSVDAHISYSQYLMFTGHTEKAIVQALRALELDPLSSRVKKDLAMAYHWNSQPDKAIDIFKEVILIDPSDVEAHSRLGGVYRAKSMRKEAIAENKIALELSDGHPFYRAILACCYYESGEKTKGDEIFETLKQEPKGKYGTSMAFYIMYKLRGEEDLAFELFKEAVNQRKFWLIIQITNPVVNDRFPDEPRYNEVLEKAGYPKIQL